MKNIVCVTDGLADYPGSCQNGQTPMSVARTPYISALAQRSKLGRVRTVPDGMIPGSDVANMNILGYNPKKCFSGRAVLEAAAHDITIEPRCAATRLNFVTLSHAAQFEQRKMISFNAGGVSDAEAVELLHSLSELEREHFPEIKLRFCESFHHVALTPGNIQSDATPPHDIVGQKVETHLPNDPLVQEFMKRGAELLAGHPINLKRKSLGKLPVNAIWLWSSGEAIHLEPFSERYGSRRACMITATDVLRGIANSMKIECISVPEATGTLSTNYLGKGQAAISALLCEGYDLAYIHIEAPDAAGHAKRPHDKITAYERIDEYIIKPIIQAMAAAGESYRLLVLPDHYTSTIDGNHSAAPVPYLLFDSTYPGIPNSNKRFTEEYVRDLPVINANCLMDLLMEGEPSNNIYRIA